MKNFIKILIMALGLGLSACGSDNNTSTVNGALTPNQNNGPTGSPTNVGRFNQNASGVQLDSIVNRALYEEVRSIFGGTFRSVNSGIILSANGQVNFNGLVGFWRLQGQAIEMVLNNATFFAFPTRFEGGICLQFEDRFRSARNRTRLFCL